MKRLKELKMRYKFLVFIFLLFAVFYLPYTARADETSDKIADLRAKIEELTKQAEMYRGNVLGKQKEADTLKRQIDILNSQIKRLETEINITDKKITTAEIELSDLEGKLFDTEQDIENKKDVIADIMGDLYEHDKTNLIISFLKSSSIASFASETQRIESLSSKLNDILSELKKEKESLETKRAQVEQKKSELENLSDQQTNQKYSLAGTKTSKNKLLTETKGQESKYQQLLSDAEKKKAEFFNELKVLEQSAVVNGTAIIHITASSLPKAGTKVFVKPYHDSFYVTQGYGMTSYAKKGAYGGAPHNGYDYASGCGSPIYAIGEGTVVASGFNNGFGNWVAVKHFAGDSMVSIYAHMNASTKLPNGTAVNTNTILGYEGTTGNSTGCHLHLSLYSDFFTYINPKNGQLYFNYFDGSINPANYIL